MTGQREFRRRSIAEEDGVRDEDGFVLVQRRLIP
jgi:hypothetical protein